MQAAEELLALEAIFGADYTSERDGFRLRMLPNPGSLDTCYVSCELLARCACFRFAHAGQSVSMRCMLHAHIIPRQCTFLCQVQPLAKSSQHCPSCCVCSALTPCRHVLHCWPAPAAIPCFSTVKMHKLIARLHLPCRLPPGYPHQALTVRLEAVQGLLMADIRLLLKELNSAAAQGARDGMVCGFQLATVCQDFLLTKNVPGTVAKATPVSFCGDNNGPAWPAASSLPW